MLSNSGFSNWRLWSTTGVLLEGSVGFGAEQLDGSLKMAAHGGERHGERFGNLPGVEIFLIAEEDDGALRLGEGVEKLLDAVHEGRVGWRDFGGGHEGFVVDLEILAATGGATAESVGGAMAGDAAEPGGEMVGAGERGQGAMALKEDILGDLFGGGGVAEDAESDGEDTRLMLGDDGLELLAGGLHSGVPRCFTRVYANGGGK